MKPSRWPLLLLAVLLATLAWRLYERYGIPLHDPRAAPRTVAPRGDLAADEKGTIALFESASPGVVYITTTAARRDRFGLDLYEIPQGTGSGFIWDDEGNVVTNYHVIHDVARGGGSAEVTLFDHSSWTARIVGWEMDKDLAVLKIAAPKGALHPIPVGGSDDLRVGQKVFAIGNPFGLDQTLTTGVISGLNREIQSVTRRPIQGVIQTDAAINPGNSGGPLLDSSARLIGVNTAIYSPSGVYAGVGFAVPVDTVNRIVPQIIRHGKVVRPGLGIVIDTDERRAQAAGGVLVLKVAPGSAAEKAGIKESRLDARGRPRLGDVITAVDGQAVKTAKDLFRVLDRRKAGETVKVTVKREGESRELTATLQALE